MASGRLADYLGKGLASARPVTLDLHPEAVGLWYSTDTDTVSAWDGSAWHVGMSGGGIPDAPSDGNTYGRKDGAWASLGGWREPNVQTVVSAATVTPTFGNDLVTITAQAVALTLANPTGTAIPGLGMVIRIKDDGTARSIVWGTQYRGIGVTVPATTFAGKTTYVAMIYNSTDTTWDVVAVGTQE